MKNVLFSKFFWAGLVICAGTIYFVFVYFTQPLISTVCGKYRAFRDKQREIDFLTEKRNLLSDLKNNEEETNRLYNLAFQYLPAAREEGGFILQVKSNANQTGETMTSIVVQEKSKDESGKKTAGKDQTDSEEIKNDGKDIKESGANENSAGKQGEQYPFTVAISGDWSSILQFMNNLENYSRLNQVQSLTLSDKSDGGLTVSIQGVIFAQKEKSLEATAENLKISSEDKKRLEALANFTPIIDFESGIGRENPFTPY